MKMTDIILVIEEAIDVEINRLMDIQDYKEYTKGMDSPEAYADRMLALGTTHAEQWPWVECQGRAGYPVSARFCGDDAQLGLFLQGHYNGGAMRRLDRDLSSQACITKMEQIGMTDQGRVNERFLRYERMDAGYMRGQVLHNFNGRDYMVLEALSEKNLVVMDLKNGSLTVALGTNTYRRYPKDQEPTEDNTVLSISWEHGIYLEGDLSATNFRAYKQEYGTLEPIRDVYDYRTRLKKKFFLLEDLTKDRLMPEHVVRAARESLYLEFGTQSERIFSQELGRGAYDSGYYETKDREDAGSHDRLERQLSFGKAR